MEIPTISGAVWQPQYGETISKRDRRWIVPNRRYFSFAAPHMPGHLGDGSRRFTLRLGVLFRSQLRSSLR